MAESNEPRDDDQFVVTYQGQIVRLWCTICDKSVNLSNLGLTDRYRADHKCGPRTAPWGSDGLR